MTKARNLLILEPYLTGSHESWVNGLKQHSSFDVDILSLPGNFWKWRMHGGAISLADAYSKVEEKPDLILATDMIDLTVFLSLTRVETNNIPTAIYFHENQLCYPWSPADRDVINKRDTHYAFINFSSALVADKVYFNSNYHKNAFLGELRKFLGSLPDNKELDKVDRIEEKSRVLSLGMNLRKFDNFKERADKPIDEPVILWNHRWEYDKNPEDFFKVVTGLKKKGKRFKLIVLGENFSSQPEVFDKSKEELQDFILHFGYTDDFETYASLVRSADILPVTSNQDFFGGSVVEAIYNGCYPLLPKRLAYPEHIPTHLSSDHLYEDLSQLESKLSLLIDNFKYPNKTELINKVSPYDWQKMIVKYDESFLSLID